MIHGRKFGSFVRVYPGLSWQVTASSFNDVNPQRFKLMFNSISNWILHMPWWVQRINYLLLRLEARIGRHLRIDAGCENRLSRGKLLEVISRNPLHAASIPGRLEQESRLTRLSLLDLSQPRCFWPRSLTQREQKESYRNGAYSIFRGLTCTNWILPN